MIKLWKTKDSVLRKNKYEIDGIAKKIIKKKPRLAEKRKKKMAKIATKIRSDDKRKRRVADIPTARSPFRPKMSSSARFSEAHLADMNNWINEEDEEVRKERQKRRISAIPSARSPFRPKTSSTARFSEADVADLDNWMNDDEDSN